MSTLHAYVEAVPASVLSIHVWQKALPLLDVLMFEVETATCGAIVLSWGLFRDRAAERQTAPKPTTTLKLQLRIRRKHQQRIAKTRVANLHLLNYSSAARHFITDHLTCEQWLNGSHLLSPVLRLTESRSASPNTLHCAIDQSQALFLPLHETGTAMSDVVAFSLQCQGV